MVYTQNKGNNMKYLEKLNKVNESFTINRYTNGYMIEVGGRDSENDWKNYKFLCTTDEELFDVIKEALALELDN